MLLTEDEAKERWCPFAREVTGDDNGVQMAMTSYNRPFGPGLEKREVCNCIASLCSQWVDLGDGKGVQACNRVQAEYAIRWLAAREGWGQL